MSTFWQDLKYGFRMQVKTPGFTAVVILTLALGIGANTCVFSIVNALAWRSWSGTAAPQRLVYLRTGLLFGSISYPDYLDYRGESTVFSGLAIYKAVPLDWRGASGTERISGTIVADNYFSLLGVKTVLGRTFLHGEKDPVAVVSHKFWKHRMASDARLLGKPLLLNGRNYTVVGITAEDFKPTDWFEEIEVWLPITMQPFAMPDAPKLLYERESASFVVIGRLKPGYSLRQAQAEIGVLSAHLDQTYHKNRNWRVEVRSASGLASLGRDEVFTFTLLMSLVGLVLIIACANVANLLLARASARRKEIAVRVALGADRGRLVRQLLTECLLLSLAGAAAALPLALGLDNLLIFLLLPPGVTLNMTLDHRVLMYALVLSLLTAAFFGLVPALQASRPDLVPALTGEVSASPHRRISASRILVVSQVALSVVLLVSAGLFVRTLRSFRAVELGFRGDDLLLSSIDLGIRHYSQDQGRLFFRNLLDRLAAIPGVESTSLAEEIPIGAHGRTHIQLEGYNSSGDRGIEVDTNIVSPAYFATMEIPLLQGREFSAQDNPGAPGVAIVSETMAHRFWPGVNPVGRRLRIVGWSLGPWLQVIAVAKDIRFRSLDQKPIPMLYLPFGQHYRTEMVLHVRSGQSKNLIEVLRRQVRALDPEVPIYSVGTFAGHLDGELLDQRFLAILAGIFALLGMLLATIGIYGVISHSIAQRTREIGIRVALGADVRDVLQLIVGQGLTLAAIGLAIGLAASLALTRLISSRLYGVGAADPVSFFTAALLTAAVALAASYIPARRAAGIDPAVNLRHE